MLLSVSFITGSIEHMPTLPPHGKASPTPNARLEETQGPGNMTYGMPSLVSNCFFVQYTTSDKSRSWRHKTLTAQELQSWLKNATSSILLPILDKNCGHVMEPIQKIETGSNECELIFFYIV